MNKSGYVLKLRGAPAWVAHVHRNGTYDETTRRPGARVWRTRQGVEKSLARMHRRHRRPIRAQSLLFDIEEV